MNLLSSSCRFCKAPMLVNAKEFAKPSSHTCVECSTTLSAWEMFGEANEQTATEAFADVFLDEEIIDNAFEGLEPKEPVCECGAEKAGHLIHSSWCPLYKTS